MIPLRYSSPSRKARLLNWLQYMPIINRSVGLNKEQFMRLDKKTMDTIMCMCGTSDFASHLDLPIHDTGTLH
jgi:hypothetical protein